MTDSKKQRYKRIYQQLAELLVKVDDPISRMASIAALLHHKLPGLLWTGFYRHVDGQLLVGPYQGPLACQSLKKDTGVCWAGINRRRTVVVPNVHEFPGHIACDSRSKAEIAVPCLNADGSVYAVLDIDSAQLNHFDDVDAAELEKIVALIGFGRARTGGLTQPLRLGILLSGGGRTMVNLQRYIDDGQLNAQIVCVISSRAQASGNDRARELGMEPHIIRRKDFADVESFSQPVAAILRQHQVDLVVQCGWLCLWQIPDDFAGRVMNIHPALLPDFGGQGMWGHHVHEAVLAAGRAESGCSVHFVTNEYDTGPIILQRRCAVLPGDTPDTLAARVFEQECLAYPQAIELFARGLLRVELNRVIIVS